MRGSLPTVHADAWFHATNRAPDGSALFSTAGESKDFVDALAGAAREFAVEIHAYCAMGNHYHVLARADEVELLEALTAVESRAVPIPTRPRLCRMAFGRHLIRVTAYIHLNPVAAGLVLNPADWPWSSYRGYLDRIDAPCWLRSDAVLGWLGSIGARRRYREKVEGNRLESELFAGSPTSIRAQASFQKFSFSAKGR